VVKVLKEMWKLKKRGEESSPTQLYYCYLNDLIVISRL
jgi:hypothetical protein